MAIREHTKSYLKVSKHLLISKPCLILKFAECGITLTFLINSTVLLGVCRISLIYWYFNIFSDFFWYYFLLVSLFVGSFSAAFLASFFVFVLNRFHTWPCSVLCCTRKGTLTLYSGLPHIWFGDLNIITIFQSYYIKILNNWKTEQIYLINLLYETKNGTWRLLL